MTDVTDETALSIAVNGAASIFASAAIVGALVERGAIDPERVAVWAEIMGKSGGSGLGPAVEADIARQLDYFAALIRSMAAVPANAGRA